MSACISQLRWSQGQSWYGIGMDSGSNSALALCLEQLLFLTYLFKFHAGQWSSSDTSQSKNKYCCKSWCLLFFTWWSSHALMRNLIGRSWESLVPNERAKCKNMNYFTHKFYLTFTIQEEISGRRCTYYLCVTIFILQRVAEIGYYNYPVELDILEYFIHW